MFDSRRVAVLAFATSAAAAIFGWRFAAAETPAATNDPGDELQEIVVNARKRDERVIDIPESIAVISEADLTSRSIQSIEDVGRQTPNLQMNMRQDLTTNVVIRGIGAYGDVLGVGFSIDNVPNFTDQTMRLEDLESVQILKGPQGTLYGGSSIGGLVRYVSKKPGFNWEGEMTTEVGDYSHINVSGAQNIPIIDNVLAMRVSAYDVKDDGYITNSALGINANPLTDYGGRVAFLYQPSDALNALLTLRSSYIENGGDMYIPVPNVKDYTNDARFFQPNFNSRKTYGSVLEINDDLHFAKLTSITSYTKANSAFDVDITQTPPGLPGESYYTLPGNRPTEVTTQELRLTSPTTDHFEWLIGAYGAIIKNVLLNQIGANYLPTPDVPTVLYDFDVNRTDTGIFGTASYHLGPLGVDAGVRLTRTDYDARVYVEAGGLPDQRNSIISRAALPKLSITYKLPNGENLYATVAEGEEPGAVNTTSTAAVPYKAETAWSYEVGTKGEALNRKIEYDVAGFYIHNISQQYESNINVPGLGLLALVNNIGDSRSYGVEANVNWLATDNWRFGLSGGYLNAKWLSASYFGEVINGFPVPNAPNATASGNVAYTQPVFSNLRFDANFDVSYTDAMWWDLPNTPGSKEHPHFLGDARIALGTDHRGWQVALRVSNLFGARYWTEYAPALYGPGTYPCPNCTDLGVPGAPRQYFGSVSYKW
jgi:iron complex outermembrane receptor protein